MLARLGYVIYWLGCGLAAIALAFAAVAYREKASRRRIDLHRPPAPRAEARWALFLNARVVIQSRTTYTKSLCVSFEWLGEPLSLQRCRYLGFEQPVIVLHRVGSRQWRRVVWPAGEPVAHAADCLVGLFLWAAISWPLISDRAAHSDAASHRGSGRACGDARVGRGGCAEVKAQLHRHVEAGHAAGDIDAGEVVDNPSHSPII